MTVEPSEQPLKHIVRACPPWRDPDRTECGKRLVDVAAFTTKDEARALAAKHGRQRAAFLLCMTCVSTAERYADWQRTPSDVIARERKSPWSTDNTPSRIDQELHAIAALVAAHRDEFDGYLDGLTETASLDARRTAARRTSTARSR